MNSDYLFKISIKRPYTDTWVETAEIIGFDKRMDVISLLRRHSYVSNMKWISSNIIENIVSDIK